MGVYGVDGALKKLRVLMAYACGNLFERSGRLFRIIYTCRWAMGDDPFLAR